VKSANGDVAATHVLNTTTQRATITSAEGFFDIQVRLRDTLIFSAVQFAKKQLVVSQAMLDSKMITVTMEEAVNELDEVVVTPYNLSGDIARDLKTLDPGPIVTASTLNLPNAYAIVPTQTERKLNEATTGGGILPLNPILNAITGRTKKLKKLLEIDNRYARTDRVREFYADSLFVTELKIPLEKINDFMYFCEADTAFSGVVDSHDHLKIWAFLRKKGASYREANQLE
tara:strand:+ start:68849 stop:69538 length:690 start_codon:yes stop_codon:yes gene_type:complete